MNVIGHYASNSGLRVSRIAGSQRARVGARRSLDLFRRDVTRRAPNELWMTDMTEQGKVYRCVVLDAFARKVVGWAIDSTQTTGLRHDSTGMATTARNPANGLVLPSDRGVQFTSWAFSRKLRDAGLVPSWEPSGSRRRCHGRVVLGTHAGRNNDKQCLL